MRLARPSMPRKCRTRGPADPEEYLGPPEVQRRRLVEPLPQQVGRLHTLGLRYLLDGLERWGPESALEHRPEEVRAGNPPRNPAPYCPRHSRHEGVAESAGCIIARVATRIQNGFVCGATIKTIAMMRLPPRFVAEAATAASRRRDRSRLRSRRRGGRTVGVADWLGAFRVLHEKARQGTLSPAESDTYLAGREELARALFVPRGLAVVRSEERRKALRVARALQVDLATPETSTRAVTLSISAGGFSVLLAKAPASGEEMKVSLRLPGADPILATVVPVGVKPQVESVNVSFTFKDLSDADRERLEFLIFDTALSQLAK